MGPKQQYSNTFKSKSFVSVFIESLVLPNVVLHARLASSNKSFATLCTTKTFRSASFFLRIIIIVLPVVVETKLFMSHNRTRCTQIVQPLTADHFFVVVDNWHVPTFDTQIRLAWMIDEASQKCLPCSRVALRARADHHQPDVLVQF